MVYYIPISSTYLIFTDCSTPPKTIYFTTYADLPQNNFSDTNDILIFYFTRNRKCKSKRRESKQSISDDDAFNNEDLDDILFRHQDEEVLDEEDRPLKPKKAKRKPRSKPAPNYGPAPERKIYNCKYCDYNGKKVEWLAHLKSAHSDKNLVCKS